MTNDYNRVREGSVKGDVLSIHDYQNHVLTGYFIISENVLCKTRQQQFTIIEIRSGTEIYRSTVEGIKYKGFRYGGYWFLPVSKWKRIKRKQKIKGKSFEKLTMRNEEKHEKGRLRKRSTFRHGVK